MTDKDKEAEDQVHTYCANFVKTQRQLCASQGRRRYRKPSLLSIQRSLRATFPVESFPWLTMARLMWWALWIFMAL